MNISITATKNPNGSVTVNWTATIEKVLRYLTITVFWARKVSTDMSLASGVYSYDSNRPTTIELTGSATVFPPPNKTPSWFIVLANICQQEPGAEIDKYECAPTVTTQPVKL